MAQKTQSQVLTDIVKKLGYKTANEIPIRSNLQEKLLNGRLTVREAVVLDMYARGVKLQEATKNTPIGAVFSELFPPDKKVFSADSPAPTAIYSRASTVINSATKAGFNLDTQFKDISNDRGAMEKIAQATKQIDPHWSGVYQSLYSTHTQTTGDVPFTYQNPKVKAAGLEGATQKRGTEKFAGVPPAREAFPQIVAGLSTVEDPSVKNALISSSLAPYRPGEIANLRLGKYDMATVEVDRPPGYFDLERGAIVFPEGRTGNKAATDLVLDKNSILYQVLSNQAKVAQELGSDQLFPGVTTGKMTTAIQENITPRMAQFEPILGRPFNESKDFRKLVASMIVGELGYAAEAEKMLGHTTDKQINDALTAVGSKHYISTVVRNANPLAAVQLSLENMIGEAIGAQTLNETALSMGLDIPGYTDDSAKPIVITKTGEQLSEKAEVLSRPLSQEEIASLEARRAKVDADLEVAAQEARGRAIDLEFENIERQKELAQKRAEVPAGQPTQSPEEKAAQDLEKVTGTSEGTSSALRGLMSKGRVLGPMAAITGLSFMTGAEKARAEGAGELGQVAAGVGYSLYDIAAPMASMAVEPAPLAGPELADQPADLPGLGPIETPFTRGQAVEAMDRDRAIVDEQKRRIEAYDAYMATKNGTTQRPADDQMNELLGDQADITITYPNEVSQ